MLTPTIEHQLSLVTQSLLLDRLHVLAAVSALSLHSNALLCLLLLRRSVLSSIISVTVHSSYLIYRQQSAVHSLKDMPASGEAVASLLMTFFRTFLRLVSALLFLVKPARVANFSISVLSSVLVNSHGKSDGSKDWLLRDTSGLDLRL